MGGTCRGTTNMGDNNFHAPDLYKRNSYPGLNFPSTQDHRRLFQSSQYFKKYSPLVSKVERSNKRYFSDENFSQANSTKLSQLYNYSHMHAKVYTPQITPYNSFDQSGIVWKHIIEIQLSYLSCVMYFFCANKFLLEKMFQTRGINDFDLYILRLFCNGRPCEVVIDDFVPTIRETLMYLKLIRGKQLWPVLIEKAWCKQVGSYKAAKGLSPEDAFEEITGLPAYSYSVDYNRGILQQLLQSALNKQQWVVLVARTSLKDIQNRQVFFLQKVVQDRFHIRSPYSKYQFRDHLIQDSNLVKISLSQLISHFQFYTIGYFYPTFQTSFCPHRSSKRQQIVYEITVRSEDIVSLRFVQLYEGYFDEENSKHYDYSPVYMELYNGNYNLVKECQGCDRSTQGARASYFSCNVFERLREGKYYLKIEVDWCNELELNEGTLVAYSSKGNVLIRPAEQQLQRLISSFHQRLIHEVQIATEVTDNIQIINVQKKNGVLLCIKNRSKEGPERIKIDMSKSRNIRFKYCQGSGSQVILSLDKGEEISIEVVPENPNAFVEIVPFEVTRP